MKPYQLIVLIIVLGLTLSLAIGKGHSETAACNYVKKGAIKIGSELAHRRTRDQIATALDAHPISGTIYITIAYEILDIGVESKLESDEDVRAFSQMIYERCISNKTFETGTLYIDGKLF